MSASIESRGILLFVASYLREFHSTKALDWERYLTPFHNLFFAYCQRSVKVSQGLSEDHEFLVPYGNNDLIHSVENHQKYYRILKGEALASRCVTRIADPCSIAIERFVFPYSRVSKIAMVTFPSLQKKLLYYLMSLGRVKKLRLDYLQRESVVECSPMRLELIDALAKSFGEVDRGMLERYALLLPSIYVENFSFYYERAKDEAAKLADVRLIYMNRHFLYNPNFLLLLCLECLADKEFVTFQHGACYGQTGPGWSERSEKELATRFLTWGYSYVAKDVPFVSLRFQKPLPWSRIREPSVKSQKKLIVLPLLFPDQDEQIRSSFDILSRIVGQRETVAVRFDPREKNQAILAGFLDDAKISWKEEDDPHGLTVVARLYKTVLFVTPNATGYLELLNLGVAPYMVFSESAFKLREESLDVYREMKSSLLWLDAGNCGDARFGPLDQGQKRALKNFQRRFIRTSYVPSLRLMHFLFRLARKGSC